MPLISSLPGYLYCDPKDIDDVYAKTYDENKIKTIHPMAKKIDLPDGSHAMRCVDCTQQFQWVEPNQEDSTFKCYVCRTGM